MKKVTKKMKFFLFLTVVFSAIVGTATWMGTDRIGQMTGMHKRHAMEEVQTYIREMNLKTSGHTCTNQDTDGDGYVSCSVELTSNGKQCPEARELDCAKWAPLEGVAGCKPKNKLEMVGR